MKDNPRWLFLEPYVHLVRQDTTLLLYNSLSKSVLEFPVSPKLRKIADELLDQASGYVVRLSASQLQSPDIQEFVSKLRQYFMGDILDPGWSSGKPVNIVPEPVVKFGLNPVPRQKSSVKPEINPRNYLQEITLYLNAGPVSDRTIHKMAFLQFSYPACFSEIDEEMDIHLLRAIMDDVNKYTPSLIHLSGYNLMIYPHLGEVIELMARSPFQKKYHFRIENWESQIVPYLQVQKHTSVALYITFPFLQERITAYLHELPDIRLMKKLEFNFVVKNQEEMETAVEIINDYGLGNVFFKPLFTGENLDFFRKNVFASKEEILAAHPDQQQVFSRITINENDFGKLSVMPGGQVYANLNDPLIGDATKEDLVQLVSHELEQGVSWRRIRKEVFPCKKCIYQFLCPPVSSYELFMQRFNFCDVYPNETEL